MHLSLKMLSGMANSEDLAQTSSGTVWSGSTLFAYGKSSETLVFEILGLLLYGAVLWYKEKNQLDW